MLVEEDIPLVGGRGIRLANEAVELVAALDYGPRILRYAPRGGENVFGFVSPAEQAKPTPFGEPWHLYGGHRLWHAPEDAVLSYVPDNSPISARMDGATLVLTRAIERETSLVKELRITLDERSSRVVVEHRITNGGDTPADVAVWGLSLMAPGGEAIFPLPPFVPFPDALLPAARLVLWPYTQLHDARFRFGDRFIRLAHDSAAAAPQKLGLFDPHHGWAAYACGNRLFVKRYRPPHPSARLPDYGSNVESFSGASFLELETLGEQRPIAPGATAVHVEAWYLFSDIVVPGDDAEAERVLARILDETSGP